MRHFIAKNQNILEAIALTLKPNNAFVVFLFMSFSITVCVNEMSSYKLIFKLLSCHAHTTAIKIDPFGIPYL